MLLVIRCPKCRAASRVDEPDLGQTVQCPRCADTFTAIEEAELIAAGPKSTRGEESANSAAGSLVVEVEQRRRSRRLPEPELETPPIEPDAAPRPAIDSDAQFDPHSEPSGSLPASVLVGLALLPFLIPIIWLIAPAVIGHEPVLSLASALALAVSASVLCLAVIYTLDWRPVTRIRGVLLLVVLSYVTGVTLYFMKKEWVDRVRKFFGVNPTWSLFQPPQAGYKAMLPGTARPVLGNQPPLGLAHLALWQANQNSIGVAGEDLFMVGSGAATPPANANDPAPGTDAWFDKVAADIAARAGGTIESTTVKAQGPIPGRQIKIKIGNDDLVRVVEVYYLAKKTRVYYAAAEGRGMSTDDPSADRFFSNFEITDVAN